MLRNTLGALIILLAGASTTFGQGKPLAVNGAKATAVMKGWAKNSINTVIFRRDPITTYKDVQYIAFYDSLSNVVLGKRKLGTSKWELKVTPYKGHTNDAHKDISIITDGKGYLHMSWDHHGNQLNYCRSISPGSLELSPLIPMTGIKENKVTYPQFLKLPNGNLLFLFRDGGSGNGDLVLNFYDTPTQKWVQRQANLIEGNGARNAYWQMDMDTKGTIHLSWVWREKPDVASNHDMCYARSKDAGLTWEKTTGEKYQMPINAETAEYAVRIPQNSELINQTSMTADKDGHPYIAIYWRDQDSKVPQYRMIYHDGIKWSVQQVGDRVTPFSLSGGGTKEIPISRPQIMLVNKAGVNVAVMIFRDVERGNKVSVAVCRDVLKGKWTVSDLTSQSVGQWEPTFDSQLWKRDGVLNLFVQKVAQADTEGLVNMPAEMVYVLDWKP